MELRKYNHMKAGLVEVLHICRAYDSPQDVTMVVFRGRHGIVYCQPLTQFMAYSNLTMAEVGDLPNLDITEQEPPAAESSLPTHVVKPAHGQPYNYVTGEVEAYDVNVVPPPRNTKCFLISKYGVARLGNYEPGFDIAWFPLLKVPESVRR